MKAKQLISEIHERSIWQLLAIYVGGSFSVVGNVELLTGTFGLPAWLLPSSLVLLAIGVISMFGVKLWPRLAGPHPRAKHSAKVGLIYMGAGWLMLEAVGLILENVESVPEVTFHVALFAYILFLPVAMVVGYRRYKPPVVSTSDGWVYERLRRGIHGKLLLEQLVNHGGLTVNTALAKMQAASERIEQETGKRPSMPTADQILRIRASTIDDG